MPKSPLKNVDPENLVGSLRGEVGDIIQSWTLMRDFYVLASEMQTDDLEEDLKNEDLNKIYLIRKKFQDEIISRLSELGKKKFGRINFHFASEKLGILKDEVIEFEGFIVENDFRDRRNQYISHKELPLNWSGHKGEHRISYTKILRALGMALSLMKKIDLHFHGPDSKYQWYEMRKRRYEYSISGKAKYLLLPHLQVTR